MTDRYKNFEENKNWGEFYRKQTQKIEYFIDGFISEFNCSTLNLPKLITRIHLSRQTAELPNIKIKDENYLDIFNNDVLQDLDVIVSNLLAFGKIFLIPIKNSKDEIEFDVISEYLPNVKNLEFYENEGELQFLKYTKKGKIFLDNKVKCVDVVYVHQMKDNVYYLTEYFEENGKVTYLNENDGNKPISIDKMLPSVHYLRINSDTVGLPIYANSTSLIIDADLCYAEINNVRDLLRPIVGIPSEHMQDFKRGDEKITAVSKYSRIFQKINGLSEQMKWEYFGGGFNPTPYLENLNFILHLISLHCGLGARYLSYDKNDGIKTAKEVSAQNNDLFINQELINRSFEDVIKTIIERAYYLMNNEFIDKKEIEVQFADNIYDTDLSYEEKLYKDLIAKAISTDFYIEESYKFYKKNMDKDDVEYAKHKESENDIY